MATCKIQTADIYRTSIDPKCPKSLCMIYEENAIVKYPGRVYIDSHHFNVLYDSQVLHGHVQFRCHTFYTWYKWAIQIFVFICLTAAAFEVISLQESDVTRWGLHLVSKQTLGKKLIFMKESERRAMGGGVREQDSANLLKGSYFHGGLVWPSITWRPRPLILLRPLTLNLISTEPYR